MQDFFSAVGSYLNSIFLTEDRWVLLLNGLLSTLMIALFAALVGIALGFILAIIRSTHDNTLKGKKCRRASDYVIKFLNAIANIYITVIRGTPTVVQLMIMYYVVFVSSRNKELVAILSFGINSGAYVAEIVRSGIMSVDKGQYEASRSLGFNYSQTMINIVLPQAIKNILPALGNEFIVLLKETSIAGYVSIQDLTYAGDLINSRTFDKFPILLTVAAVYLILVMILSAILKHFERRLRNSDH